jgi:hypothetical protein
VCTVCASPVGACARLGGVAHAATCRTVTHAAQSTACAPTEPVSAPTAGTASTAPSRVSRRRWYFSQVAYVSVSVPDP